MTISRLTALALLAALFALGVGARVPELTRVVGAPNLDAPYHVLLTATALDESPVSEHLLLPTVSLGGARDKGIPWGATIRTADGDYIYSSFAAPGFVAPFLFLEATGLPRTLPSLMLFNLLLQAGACLLLYALIVRLLALGGVAASRARLAAVVGTAVQLFGSEALLSFGIVYWVHQLYQLMFLGGLLALTMLFARDGRDARGPIAALVALAFLGAWTEWTAVVFNGVVVLALLYRARTAHRYLAPALLVALATALGLATMLLHYALALGIEPTLRAFARRFLERSAVHASPADLLLGHWQSWGLLLAIAPLLVAAGWRARRPSASRETMSRALGHPALLVALCATLPLVENILMMQHASEYSFDRLKAAVPLAIAIAWGLARLGRGSFAFGTMVVAAALVQNYAAYRQRLLPYAPWARIDAANRALAAAVGRRVDLRCAALATDAQVRGYANLLVHRAIHEQVWPERFPAFAAATSGASCGAVYLRGAPAAPSLLPRFTEATVIAGGQAVRITAPR